MVIDEILCDGSGYGTDVMWWAGRNGMGMDAMWRDFDIDIDDAN